jgi:hypothetical protein
VKKKTLTNCLILGQKLLFIILKKTRRNSGICMNISQRKLVFEQGERNQGSEGGYGKQREAKRSKNQQNKTAQRPQKSRSTSDAVVIIFAESIVWFASLWSLYAAVIDHLARTN